MCPCTGDAGDTPGSRTRTRVENQPAAREWPPRPPPARLSRYRRGFFGTLRGALLGLSGPEERGDEAVDEAPPSSEAPLPLETVTNLDVTPGVSLRMHVDLDRIALCHVPHDDPPAQVYHRGQATNRGVDTGTSAGVDRVYGPLGAKGRRLMRERRGREPPFHRGLALPRVTSSRSFPPWESLPLDPAQKNASARWWSPCRWRSPRRGCQGGTREASGLGCDDSPGVREPLRGLFRLAGRSSSTQPRERRERGTSARQSRQEHRLSTPGRSRQDSLGARRGRTVASLATGEGQPPTSPRLHARQRAGRGDRVECSPVQSRRGEMPAVGAEGAQGDLVRVAVLGIPGNQLHPASITSRHSRTSKPLVSGTSPGGRWTGARSSGRRRARDGKAAPGSPPASSPLPRVALQKQRVFVARHAQARALHQRPRTQAHDQRAGGGRGSGR